MIINLYRNVSEPNVVQKMITSMASLDGVLRDESSVYQPSILIEFNPQALSQLIHANYAQIPEFQRYYYIKDIVALRHKMWILELICDVLMSFSTGIKQSTAIVSETKIAGTDNYLENDVWVSKVKDMTEIINFPSGLPSSGEYILITAGGD